VVSADSNLEASADPAGELAPGVVFDSKYEIAEFVASGGMGFIYRARDIETSRSVALKVMRAFLNDEPSAVKRFGREAWTISQLQHPNTVRLLSYGTNPDGLMYLVMEWLEGRNLSQLLNANGALSPALVAWIGATIARCLQEAHDKGIIHRDIKPENVVLLESSETFEMVKVLDFGIAKIGVKGDAVTLITQTGTVCGTPEYMSPEQAKGEELDGRSDVYSLGCLLFALCAARVPYHADSPLQVLFGHLTKPFPELPESVPEPLAEVIYKSTRKNPAHRFASAREMAQALEILLPILDDEKPGGVGTGENFDALKTIIEPLGVMGLFPSNSGFEVVKAENGKVTGPSAEFQLQLFFADASEHDIVAPLAPPPSAQQNQIRTGDSAVFPDAKTLLKTPIVAAPRPLVDHQHIIGPTPIAQSRMPLLLMFVSLLVVFVLATIVLYVL